MDELWASLSYVCWSTTPLLHSTEWSVDFGSLFTTTVGALAGAGVGAWTAGYISEKNKLREQLTKEIRDTNATILLALGVTNTGIALKKQHVKALKDDYYEQREKSQQILAGAAQTESLQLNFLELDEISPPILHLQELVLSRLSTAGRALASVTALSDAVINLNSVLRRRNELIIRFKTSDFPPGISKEYFYFGLPSNGAVDEGYANSVEAISTYTDDIIFFGSELCADLLEHVELLISKYSKKRLGESPEANRYDLSQAIQEGWIPAAERYDAWTSGFKKNEKKQPDKGFLSCFKRRK